MENQEKIFTSPSQRSREQSKFTDTQLGCLITFIIVGIICFVWISSSPKEPNQEQEIKPVDKSTEAFVFSQQFVEEKIASPSTAQFAIMPDSKVSRNNDGSYHVESYLDAHNRYGAMVRMEYSCDINFVAEDRARCMNLRIDER